MFNQHFTPYCLKSVNFNAQRHLSPCFQVCSSLLNQICVSKLKNHLINLSLGFKGISKGKKSPVRIFENKQKTNCTYLKEVDIRLTEEYRKSSDKWNETMVEMKDHLLEIHKRNRGIELNSKYNV